MLLTKQWGPISSTKNTSKGLRDRAAVIRQQQKQKQLGSEEVQAQAVCCASMKCATYAGQQCTAISIFVPHHNHSRPGDDG